jgi:hypothetical protein
VTQSPEPAVPHDAAGVVRDTWIQVFGGAVRGLTHALGNRLHSLEMTMGALAPGEAVSPIAAAALDVESAGCAELVRLYRLLPFAGAGALEASRVGDVVPDAAALFRHHIDGRQAACTVHVSGEPPAVLVAPLALTQAVLVLLCSSVAEAPEGSATEVTIGVSGDADVVWIDIHATGPGDGVADDNAMATAAWLLKASQPGVTRVATGSGAITRIALPSLSAARQRERARG